MTITSPGFYPSLTPAQYFAEPCPVAALSCSGMKLLLHAPAKFRHWHPALNPDTPTARESTALRMGSLVHRLALGKGDDYAISPFDEYRSKEARAWRDEHLAAGIAPIKQAEFDKVSLMATVLAASIARATEGQPIETEVVMAWTETIDGVTVWCRAMVDVWCPSLGLALDLKTCESASDAWVNRAFANGYALQETFYERGLHRLGAKRAEMPFLFIEKDEPHLTRVVRGSEAFRTGAEMTVERALRVMARCQSTDEWPGFEPFTATPPAWWLNDVTAAEYQEAA